MDLMFWILRAVITIWVLVSPLVCLYWVFRPPDMFWAQHRRISYAVFIGAFFASWFIITGGIRPVLWFIPATWVYETEEGDTQLVSTTISACFALGITCCITRVLEKVCLRKHREQTACIIEFLIVREQQKLNSAVSETEKEKLLADLKTEKATLDRLEWENTLTPAQKRRLSVLSGLFDELQQKHRQQHYLHAKHNRSAFVMDYRSRYDRWLKRRRREVAEKCQCPYCQSLLKDKEDETQDGEK